MTNFIERSIIEYLDLEPRVYSLPAQQENFIQTVSVQLQREKITTPLDDFLAEALAVSTFRGIVFSALSRDGEMYDHLFVYIFEDMSDYFKDLKDGRANKEQKDVMEAVYPLDKAMWDIDQSNKHGFYFINTPDFEQVFPQWIRKFAPANVGGIEEDDKDVEWIKGEQVYTDF